MEPSPIPCPAPLVPDVTALAALDTAYKAARMRQAVFIAVEYQGSHWAVKADTRAAGPEHTTDDAASAAIGAAFLYLARRREIRFDAFTGPVYFVLHDIAAEDRARELAAALHAALYGDLGPLRAALPVDI
ncbi:hypothetical protein OG462_42395 [Streptomyces sp. NBC_01077]|uniref:hypothetical protein n=1 Tax=Streptomyces sp. NBC_01077 TaxID=2903746 RepID=UPI00386B2451|nr:hypothetical protein OG462_02625 [Streptomyces sp. NBC_01077]WSV43495.1 hypothetical protein OG462_42395 [Streptomyces sp. NBC_01077]